MKNDYEKHKKIYDLINLKEWEVLASLIVTLLFVVTSVFNNFYEEFKVYESAVGNLSTNILNAFIGLLGFSLSGIAIVVSMFSVKESLLIEQYNGKGKISDILRSYVFLAANIAIQCIILIALYFVICSNATLVIKEIFYLIMFLEIYHIVFIILYTVALVKNCIKLYKIKCTYNQIDAQGKTISDVANEVKIDYVLSTLSNVCECTNEEVIDDMLRFVDEGNVDNKKEIIEYIKRQYNK